MSQNSSKFLVALTIILTIAVASAGGFLVVKDKKISFFKEKTKEASVPTAQVFSKTKFPQFKQGFADTTQATLDDLKTNTEIGNVNPDNLTDALSAIIAGQAVATGLDPVQASENLNRAFSEQLGNAKDLFSVPEIPDSELNISSDDSIEAQKEYTKTLSKILATYSPSAVFAKSDIEVAQKAVEDKNFEELNQYIKAYQALYDKIIKVSVPVAWLEIHKEQLGIFKITRQLLESYRNIELDPVKAAVAAEKYPEILQQAYSLAVKIEDKMTLLK